VAIGIAIDAVYASHQGLLRRELASELCDLLLRLGFVLGSPFLTQRAQGKLEVLGGLEEFREHIGGELLVTLISDVGESRYVTDVDLEVMERSVLEVAALGERAP
jgi:3-dehydroquinate synthase